jgi:hypothetical protein
MEMATIKNALWSPLTVELLQGKMILLDPRGTQTITDEEFASEGFQQLFQAGKIHVLPPQPADRKVPAKGKN